MVELPLLVEKPSIIHWCAHTGTSYLFLRANKQKSNAKIMHLNSNFTTLTLQRHITTTESEHDEIAENE